MWGRIWGQMLWGRATAVPAIPAWAVLLLSALLLWIGYRLGKKPRLPRWLPLATVVLAFLLPVTLVRASTFTVPFTFANGTIADATQVNQNFSTVAAEIDRLRKQTDSLSDCAFLPRSSNVGFQCGLGFDGSYITDGTDGTLFAPLQLPSGAVITSVDVWVSDTNPNANLFVGLILMNDASGNHGFFGGVESSGTPGIVKLTYSPNATQGSTGVYALQVTSVNTSDVLINWPTGPANSLNVRSAYVHYELP